LPVRHPVDRDEGGHGNQHVIVVPPARGGLLLVEHAHDPILTPVQADLAVDRIREGEEFLGHGVADHRDTAARLHVDCGEIPPQPHIVRVVGWIDRIASDDGELGVRLLSLVLGLETEIPDLATHEIGRFDLVPDGLRVGERERGRRIAFRRSASELNPAGHFWTWNV
jgi:hypothetical protein